MRAIATFAVMGLAGAIVALGGCSGGGNGISTASVLDGNASGAIGQAQPILPEDPNARTTQVAWTSARAQRCGFVFDPAKLKANFMASEAARIGPTGAGANTEKFYDQTFAATAAQVKADPDYCSRDKTAAVKADLQRHLAGNYDPNPAKAPKKVASGGFFDGLISDEPQEKMDPKTFWQDLEAKKNGAKGAQKSE